MVPLLVKIFDKEQYANEFLSGVLYSNRLSYFKKLEDEEGRGDRHEGGIFIPTDDAMIKLTATGYGNRNFERITIPPEDLAAAVRIGPNWFDHMNIFCMYSCYGRVVDISKDGNRASKTSFEMPSDNLKLGAYLVAVVDMNAFLDRFRIGAQQLNYASMDGRVKYFDPEQGSPSFKSKEETIFMKREIFEDQKEYRLAFDTGTIGSSAIKLKIGSIEDIALRVSAVD